MNKYIYANWCLSNNFGDLLTPYIIEYLSGENCIYALPDSNSQKYMVIGTILNWDIKNTITWGTGIGNRNDNIQQKDIRSVRGKITLARMQECGLKIDNITVGDPALLMPLLYNPDIEKTHDIGIIPHYVDLEYVISKYNGIYKIINPLNPVEKVIDEILTCKRIASSSLHGLIISETYGLESQWIKCSNNIGGDGTKYHDHYSSIDRNESCIDIKSTSIESIHFTRKLIPETVIVNLLNTCPFLNPIIKEDILKNITKM